MRSQKIDTTRRGRLPSVSSVTVEYTRSTGKRLTYAITATKLGAYSIALGEKTVRVVGAALAGFGRPSTGSQAQLDDAIARAKADVEALTGFSEEG
jgi:hypothetical protein